MEGLTIEALVENDWFILLEVIIYAKNSRIASDHIGPSHTHFLRPFPLQGTDGT